MSLPTNESLATATRTTVQNRTVLRDIPYRVFLALRAPEENNHVRMDYWNGTLTIMSPGYLHDLSGQRLALLIPFVALVFDIPMSSAGSTTLSRPGIGPRKGFGKEPDASFYFANEPRIRGNTEIQLEVDPPPDLAIEVENSRNLGRKLATYAHLGVPELWRYNVKTGRLWFGALHEDGTYLPIERSRSLPMLTPAIVLDLLARGQGVDQTRWFRETMDWLRDALLPRYRQEVGG